MPLIIPDTIFHGKLPCERSVSLCFFLSAKRDASPVSFALAARPAPASFVVAAMKQLYLGGKSAELLLQQYPDPQSVKEPWSPPKPRRLGCRPLNAAQLRDLARGDEEPPNWL
jgi:hypothetical protein